ncbi:MAG: DUF1566 domain-containing protein [Treponema sp.]|nr:DUF1566 domain-containing protein [Treponema sp.]
MYGGGALIATSCANNSNSSNNGGSGGSEAPIGPIGSKSAPDAVGDIVFSDGTAEAYSAGLNLTQAQKNAAVAVIFYTAPINTTSGSIDLGTKKLGVGFKKGASLKWAPSSATGFSTTFSTSESDGSGYWTVIKNADSTGAASAATNYPAFNFCNAYGVAVAGSSTGWYLPAKNELEALCWKRGSVDSYIGKVDESGTIVDKLGDYDYWSSSQISDQNDVAWTANFGSGLTNRTQKGNPLSVRAIRVFN